MDEKNGCRLNAITFNLYFSSTLLPPNRAFSAAWIRFCSDSMSFRDWNDALLEYLTKHWTALLSQWHSDDKRAYQKIIAEWIRLAFWECTTVEYLAIFDFYILAKGQWDFIYSLFYCSTTHESESSRGVIKSSCFLGVNCSNLF